MSQIQIQRSGRLLLVSGPGRTSLPADVYGWVANELTYFERRFDYTAGPGRSIDMIDRQLYTPGPAPKTLIFPIGMRSRITKGLQAAGHQITNIGGSLFDEYTRTPEEHIDWAGLFAEFKIYPDQQELLTKAVASEGGIFSAPTGAGKAQPLDALIITPRGPVRMVDIRIGDELCHPNGGTTRVVAIHPQGVVPIYRVVFADHSEVRCCGNHLWSVRTRGRKTPYYLRTTDWMRKRIRKHGSYDLYIATPKPVFFAARPVVIPPYTMGVLIGDGSLTQSVVRWCKPDRLIVDEVRKELPESLVVSTCGDDHLIVAADEHRSRFMPGDAADWHPYRRELRKLGLMGRSSLEKFIPEDYLCNSENVRWEVLRGLMDTDGSVDQDGGTCEYSTSSPQLADDFQFLVSSLGGTATRNLKKTTHADSYRFYVKFDDRSLMFKVATKKSKLTRFSTYAETIRKVRRVVRDGKAAAQCITVEAADGMYLTEQCIPTHNSVCLRMLCRMYSRAHIHVVTKSATLADEIYTDLSAVLPDAGIRGGGKNQPGRVTVFVADSLHHGMGQASLVLIDEIHEMAAPKYVAKLGMYRRARMFGFSASPKGRMDNCDVLAEALCGPVLHEMSYQEAEQAGRVVPITVEWLRMPHGPDTDGIRNLAIKDRHAIWQNEFRNWTIAVRARQLAPEEQTMIMVKTIDHAVHLRRLLPEYQLAYAANGMDAERLRDYIKRGLLPPDEPLMTPARLSELRRAFAEGTLKKVISNYVWSTGVNFRHLTVLIRADAAASTIRDVQIPGRACRRVAGSKESALLIDCWDEWDARLLRKSQSRRRNYVGKGWTQIFPQNTNNVQVVSV